MTNAVVWKHFIWIFFFICFHLAFRKNICFAFKNSIIKNLIAPFLENKYQVQPAALEQKFLAKAKGPLLTSCTTRMLGKFSLPKQQTEKTLHFMQGSILILKIFSIEREVFFVLFFNSSIVKKYSNQETKLYQISHAIFLSDYSTLTYFSYLWEIL